MGRVPKSLEWIATVCAGFAEAWHCVLRGSWDVAWSKGERLNSAELDNRAIAAIMGLRALLGSAPELHALRSGGTLVTVTFTFGPPAPPDAIEQVEHDLHLSLPIVYREFLAHYDGAVLYAEPPHYQRGFRLFGTQNLVAGNTALRGMHETGWIPGRLACAECFGVADYLVLDPQQPTQDGRDCAVLDAFSGTRPSDWKSAAKSFGEWLDHLVIAQGAAYWLWR